MTEYEITTVKPLGVFGPRSGHALVLSKQQLSNLREALDGDIRQRVAKYLRGGTIIIPLMEYTTDILEGAFGVPGGSGIMSDGTYYWRQDAADYVLHYGIDVGADALYHIQANDWNPPRKLSLKEILRIDSYLDRTLRG
jgi:hypothetical protein